MKIITETQTQYVTGGYVSCADLAIVGTISAVLFTLSDIAINGYDTVYNNWKQMGENLSAYFY